MLANIGGMVYNFNNNIVVIIKIRGGKGTQKGGKNEKAISNHLGTLLGILDDTRRLSSWH
jgi:hypothetical protein